MAAFRPFELEAIDILCKGSLSPTQLKAVSDAADVHSYDYTGGGYFLTIRDPCLGEPRLICGEPAVVGSSGQITAGFIVFLGDGELLLECHTWGEVDVPEDFRDRDVQISTPPVNFIDLRGIHDDAGQP